MKNVFGYEDIKILDGYCDGEPFIAASIPESLSDELEDAVQKKKDASSKTASRWIKLLNNYSALFFVFSLFGIIINCVPDGLSALQGEKMLLLPILVVSAIVWVVTKKLKKSKSAEEDSKLEAAEAKVKAVRERCEGALGVPYDRKKVDILEWWYDRKNHDKGDLESSEKSLFREDDKLCIATDENLFALPISGFTRYVLKKEEADMYEWHKDVAFDEGEYRQYNIKHEELDYYLCRYYALQYCEGYDEFEIFFPEYELPYFKAIVDVPVEEE